LFFADGVGDAIVPKLPSGGGRVVIGSSNNGADAPDFAIGLSQALIGLSAGDFMNQVSIDVQNRRAVFFNMNNMFIPNFVVKRASHGVALSCSLEKTNILGSKSAFFSAHTYF
jgi:hypothetical protein